MPSCTCCGAVAPGECYLTSFLRGRPSIATFADGNAKASGSKSCEPCACRCAPSKGEILSRVRRSSTVNRSKPVRCAARRKATTQGKNRQGKSADRERVVYSGKNVV